MTVSSAESQPLRVVRQSAARRRTGSAWLAVVCGSAMLAATGPLLWKFFLDLWSRPQYEFFPLLLLAIPFVAVTCLRDTPADAVRPGHPAIGGWVWAMAWAALAVGGAMYLRWFAPVSAGLTLIGIVWMLGGLGLLRALWPVGVLLLLILPPPGQSDQVVLVALRQMAVACAGRVLDLIGVPQYVHGAVIDVPGDRLMVEEACSGINSMLAVLAFTILLAFWKRLPLKSLLVLLPASFCFVFWANVGRITLCATAKVWWGLDLLKGSPHELLGIGLFVGCMALIFSTERLGDGLFGWDEEADDRADHDEAGRRRVSRGTPGPAGAEAAAHTAASLMRRDDPTHQRSLTRRGTLGVWVVAAGAFVVTGAWAGVRTWDAWPVSALPTAGAFRMPAELAGWTQVDDKDRGPERAEVSGRQSRLWQYRRGPLVATIGVDYPFAGYHEATTCYALAGWDLTGSNEITVPGGPVRRDVTMVRPPLSQGTMAFALCDESGRWWHRPGRVGAESFVRQSLRLSYERAVSPPLAQLQVLRVGYQPPSRTEQADLDRLFDAAAGQLARQVRDLAAAGGR